MLHKHAALRLAVAAGAGVLLLMSVGAAVTTASANTKNGPNLAVDSVEPDLSKPPYLVVETSGKLQPFCVRVVISNKGNRTAGTSTLSVQAYDDQGGVAKNDVDVGRIKPSDPPVHKKVCLKDTEGGVHLGFGEVIAFAYYGHKPADVDLSNNHKTSGRIAMVADRWNVEKMKTTERIPPTGPLWVAKYTTSAEQGFYFKLRGASDGEFHYDEYGAVKGDATESGTCTGSASMTGEEDPWTGEDSELWIKENLEHYGALVEASSLPPYPITLTPIVPGFNCGTNPTESFLDLLTYTKSHKGNKSSPESTSLANPGVKDGAGQKFSWKFVADIPGAK